jgi:hypothetical protein
MLAAFPELSNAILTQNSWLDLLANSSLIAASDSKRPQAAGNPRIVLPNRTGNRSSALTWLVPSWLTEVCPRLWLCALRHAVQVCNYLPVVIEGNITTAFEQVYKSQPNFQAILYPILSHGYFRRTRDSNCERLHFEPQTQPGTAIGHSELANGLMFWNPVTNWISVLADYRLDPLGGLPSPFNIKFDGPLECAPLASESDITEPFPPGNSVFVQHKNVSTRATVLSVSLDSSDTAKEHHYYTVNLVTGSNLQLPRDSLSAAPYTEAKSSLKHDDTHNGIMSLPNWFQHNQKFMLDIYGT